MNTSGEAADQVMRMMLNGAEVLVKLSGSGAKNAAVLYLLTLWWHKTEYPQNPHHRESCGIYAVPRPRGMSQEWSVYR